MLCVAFEQLEEHTGIFLSDVKLSEIPGQIVDGTRKHC